MTPEATATVRDENWLPSTTTPAAAPPTARPLGARDQNSVGPKIWNQPRISRLYRAWTASPLLTFCHNWPRERLYAAEMVAASSYQKEGRPAPAKLTAAANT